MELITHFLRALHATGYAPATIAGYRYLLRDLHRFLDEQQHVNITRCRERDILAYLHHIERRQSKPVLFNTVCRLRIFFRYLVDQDLIFYSPVETYRMPKQRSISRSVVSAETMRELLDSIRGEQPLHIRTKAILELAYSSALRSCEIRKLRIEHLDAAAGMLYIERSKNRRDRMVPVGAQAMETVDRYLQDVRPRFLSRQSLSYIFISHRGGNPLSASGFWRGIAATLEACSIPPIPPHTIRASSATALLESGMHVGFIAELLGHTELSTTQVYLRINELSLNSEVANRHPRFAMTIPGDNP